MVLAEILGWEILIPLALIALLFGGSQIPKIARGLGSAQHEFKKGLSEGKPDSEQDEKS